MRSHVDVADLKELFTCVAAEVSKHRDRLTELDSAMGDGDLGVTMTSGFEAVARELGKEGEDEVGAVFMKAGMTFNRVAPSTMGTLLATAFIRGGSVSKEKSSLGLEDWAAFFEAGMKGIMERGKAQLGDKTILDAMHPFTTTLREQSEAGASLVDGWEAATEAAWEAVERTREMPSRMGRAAVFGEKTIGKVDPGAFGFAVVVTGVLRFLGSPS